MATVPELIGTLAGVTPLDAAAWGWVARTLREARVMHYQPRSNVAPPPVSIADAASLLIGACAPTMTGAPAFVRAAGAMRELGGEGQAFGTALADALSGWSYWRDLFHIASLANDLGDDWRAVVSLRIAGLSVEINRYGTAAASARIKVWCEDLDPVDRIFSITAPVGESGMIVTTLFNARVIDAVHNTVFGVTP
jgi:hypothetical protein